MLGFTDRPFFVSVSYGNLDNILEQGFVAIVTNLWKNLLKFG